MRILHISSHPDIRAWKQAVIMIDRGHEVDFASPGSAFNDAAFTRVYTYRTNVQLRKTIQESAADVIHVHSDPNWLVPMVKECAGSIPVIHDVHDPESMRTGKEPDEHEKTAMSVADAIIHVSKTCRAWSERVHGNGKPTTIIYSAVPVSRYGKIQNGNFNAIVYQGGLTSAMHAPDGLAYFRNLHYVVDKFISQGFHFSLFAAGEYELDQSYTSMGAFVMRHVPYTDLLVGMRLHGFGFVGSPVVTPIIKGAMPNKLFEYISQGVVPVCWNAEEAGEYVEELGIGIHLHGELDDLREKLKDGFKVREKLLRLRHDLAMESQAVKLESFYRSLI